MDASCRIAGAWLLQCLVWLTLCSIAFAAPDWVDPDTPGAALITQAYTDGDDRSYRLVFSDEFQQDGRTFHDGHDPRWTALDKNDITNNPLHYYSQDSVTTNNGVLNLTIDSSPKKFPIHNGSNETETKNFRSGMLQSWNKFCFTGGILEVSVKLPGDPTVGGLWPAIWMMGNLARATFVNSTEHIWPYSTNVCDDRTRYGQQEINSCSSGIGRGAPEIDLLETMYMRPWPHPVLSTSLQVAPGIEKYRPKVGNPPNASQVWYPDLEYGNETMASLNTYFYGARFFEDADHSFQTDAVSANMFLGDSHFFRQHIYRLEWEPPGKERDDAGYLRWFIDGKLVTGIPGESLRVSGTEIPSEPMYLMMNLAVSKDWAMPDAYFLNCKCKCYDCSDPCCRACALPEGFCENLPSSLEVDFVRVYQADSKHILGCSPRERPTKRFIQTHMDRYKLPQQASPLLPIQKGGGSCRNDHDCGGYEGRGTCVRTRNYTCKCSVLYTGPRCLAHAARDPVSWLNVGIVVGLALSSIVLLVIVLWGLRVLASKEHVPSHPYSQLSDVAHSSKNGVYSNGVVTNGVHIANGSPSYQHNSLIARGYHGNPLPRVVEEER